MTDKKQVCVECHLGIMQVKHVTYFTHIQQDLITVPNFPAWMCDVCGRCEYDLQSLHWLNTLLDPNAGKPTATKRRTPPLPRPQVGYRRPAFDS
jgi:YgiT-type zinc finger domain-containing protein